MYVSLQQTCKQGLQLLTLVGDDVVGGRDEGAAGTVDAQLQAKIVLWSKKKNRHDGEIYKHSFYGWLWETDAWCWGWPGSDNQSLMVSVTSTDIQDPFALGWTGAWSRCNAQWRCCPHLAAAADTENTGDRDGGNRWRINSLSPESQWKL